MDERTRLQKRIFELEVALSEYIVRHGASKLAVKVMLEREAETDPPIQ